MGDTQPKPPRRNGNGRVLIVERSMGTSVRIGENVCVAIHAIKGRKNVKLAIWAPPEIPVRREELLEREWKANLDSDVGGNGNGREAFRVLVIEDNEAHGTLIRGALVANGVENIELCNTGEAAVALLSAIPEDQRPGLVLVDYRLPDINGDEVIRRIRALPVKHTVPIVVLTASGSGETVDVCMEAGANAFIEKFATYTELEQAIGEMVAFWSRVRM